MISPTHIWNGRKTIAVVGNQWGDECKGKVVDALSEAADVIARFVGGPNAGHTVVLANERFAFHQITSGILRDGEGKTNLMCRGTAIDPRILIHELDQLTARGRTHRNFYISGDAKLIMPQHILLDFLPEILEGSLDVGTTKRGMGPCMTDHTARNPGMIVNDMRNPDVLRQKLEKNLTTARLLLRGCDPERVKTYMHHERLQNGAFWHPEQIFNTDAIVDAYMGYGERLRDLIRDTDKMLRDAAAKGLRILFEATQGLLLDVEKGTRPFVTSSVVTKDGIRIGSGLDCEPDLVVGVAKAIQARVGNGPMPTELGGAKSYEWCQKTRIGNRGVRKEDELALYPDVSINDPDPFLQGIALRRASNDYGTTTQRPRRVGWLDFPLLRHAFNTNGYVIALTMLDVLRNARIVKMCNSYRFTGTHEKDGRELAGTRLTTAYPAAEILDHCEPEYLELPGWEEDISECRTLAELPRACRAYVRCILERTGATAPILGVGARREEAIFEPLTA